MGCNQSTSVTVDKSNQPTSTTTYTLSYFDFTGRAEVSRLLFSLAGQKFEDKRLSPQEWGALKPKSQTGGMPILEVDGQSISQSIAIARFVARRFGFAGKNNVEAAQADMIVDWISDVINAAMALAKAGEEEKTKFLEETLPNGLETLEKLLNGKKFFVGKQVTWADIMFYSTFGILLPTTYQLPVPWEKAPHGHKLLERVAQIPQVKKWVNKEIAPEDSKFTLTYFDFTGRAEVSRLLFALAKQDFEDMRVSPQQWGAMKPNSMTGGLPELEVNGHTISQSLSIARAIARRFGFAGKNNVEAAQADMIVDCISELVNATMVLSGIPKDEQGETREKLTSETIPASLETLEKNLGGKKYFVGNNVTWADVMYFATLAILLPKTYGLTVDWNTAPKGKQLLERVGKIPQIKAYMEKS